MTGEDELLPVRDWVYEQRILLTAFEAFTLLTKRGRALPRDHTPQEWKELFDSFSQDFSGSISSNDVPLTRNAHDGE